MEFGQEVDPTDSKIFLTTTWDIPFGFLQLLGSFLNTTMRFNEIIDEFGSLLIFQLCLCDTDGIKQSLPLRINVVHVKTALWIPTNMTNMPEEEDKKTIKLISVDSNSQYFIVFFKILG